MSTAASGSLSSWILYTIVFVILSKTQVASADKSTERQHEVDKKRQDLLPYPRIGRSTDAVKGLLLSLREQAMLMDEYANSQDGQEQKKPPTKHHEKSPDHPMPLSEYMLPYLRPGRSQGSDQNDDDNEDSDSDEEGETTMIPYPRFGRSNEIDSAQTVIPYPRFGKSTTSENELLVPYPRFGRSAAEETYLDTLTPYPRFGKRQGNFEMVIPYPRFGKRQSDDILLPYPRFGRSDSSRKDQLNVLQWKTLTGDSEYITPYPRLGKRSEKLNLLTLAGPNPELVRVPSYLSLGKRNSDSGTLLPTFRLGRRSGSLLPQTRLGRNYDLQTIVPYPRFGRSQNEAIYMTPYPRLGKRIVNVRPEKAEDYIRFLEDVLQESNSITPYPRLGKSLTNEENETYLLPQIRIGRSTDQIAKRVVKRNTNSVLLNRSVRNEGNSYNDSSDATNSLQDTMVPYPRLGRSKPTSDSHNRQRKSVVGESILPYPRFGRSKESLKWQTGEGDSNNKAKAHFQKILFNPAEQNYMLPYMRPGRSSQGQTESGSLTLIPYLRMGRSGFLKPEP